MKPTNETEAMRALSDLYRTEAERIDSTRMQTAASVTMESGHFREQPAIPMEQWISAVRANHPKASGVSQETAWKILTVTFGVTSLVGFLAFLLIDKAPSSHSPPTTSLEIQPSCLDLVPSDAPQQKAQSSLSVEGQSATTSFLGEGAHSKVSRLKNTRNKTAVQEKSDAKGKGKGKGKNTDGLDFFKDCGMDPMCGYDKKN